MYIILWILCRKAQTTEYTCVNLIPINLKKTKLAGKKNLQQNW